MDSQDTDGMTPPPSTQVPHPRGKGQRTPTPPISHISTPPPTVEIGQPDKRQAIGASSMATDDIESASAEELRGKLNEVHTLLKEAKTSAAHYRLQYQMLCQESAAAIERMQVEARMAQFENDVIYSAEQAKAAAAPQRSPSLFREEGLIKVDKNLFQSVLKECNSLREENAYLESQVRTLEKGVEQREFEISSLTDNISLLRDRIRSNSRFRSQQPSSKVDSTPRSAYGTPHRQSHRGSQQSGGAYEQPFAALLQASEIASQASQQSTRPNKRGHTRGTLSTSSLPVAPQYHRKDQRMIHHTPPMPQRYGLKVPSTAPVQHTSSMRTIDVYSHARLPITQSDQQSEGTVSASDHEDDSEAETDIIEPQESDTIPESQASMTASQMLRSSQDERSSARSSFKDSLGANKAPQVTNMVKPPGGQKLTQTKLFGAVRKANVRRGGDEPPAKRARTTGSSVGVGLGIEGVGRH